MISYVLVQTVIIYIFLKNIEIYMGKGLYIHIPLCFKKCNYCNFVSYPISKVKFKITDYIKTLKKEMKEFENEKIDTVYIGGGTPSLLDPEEIENIVSGIKQNFKVSGLEEFTIEINPFDFNIENIRKMQKSGINRFSFGFQSFDNNKLEKLGRIHRRRDLENIKKYREEFNNFSLDLIFGLKNDIKLIESELRKLIEFNPQHISIYNLKVEKNTKIFKMLENNKIELDNEDAQSKTYSYINRLLKENGYNHYEISNYAKKGFESKHNLKYWRFKPYIGLGVSASGYYDNILYTNYSSYDKYKNNGYKSIQKEIKKVQKRYFRIMMGLRLKEGVILNKEEYSIIRKFFDKNNLDKYFIFRNKRISIKEKYFFISNSLIGRILDELF
ncbi:MAG: radical SAM family heme chaperone HemW [Candidatus Mcinerneyibacterium aminivorans]|uniref:Heme chaperone HemW n=1 Tax=Candidatus Mcinerneyibacterium aminivorans TaxID=2703815 RepID=A0A5D0MJI6_9BACT|nr:MAG: radical SAM family heme chaperone HemW [Candidatus Mcinerneyibacterium aminivorans]